MSATPFLARQERFAVVGSTNDVVRRWLEEGTPEVCLAVADEQSAGRGRAGRSWTAPPGAALLLSLGFRPTWLPPERAWRLAATVALAMADAAEEVAGLSDGTLRIKWPNDLVVEAEVARDAPPPAASSPGSARWEHAADGRDPVAVAVLKLAGLLGESDGLGTDEPRVVVGIGVNAEWKPSEFPPELAPTMTSLFEASRGRPIDLALLLDGFLGRLEVRIEALRAGRFDLGDWNARQITTGRDVTIERPDGSVETVRAVGVDAASGGLLVEEADGGDRIVHVGEIRHVRVAPRAATAPAPSGASAATAAGRV